MCTTCCMLAACIRPQFLYAFFQISEVDIMEGAVLS